MDPKQMILPDHASLSPRPETEAPGVGPVLPAYMTAEASMLLPLLIAVLLAVFTLSGFVFDRSVLSSVTCAAAVTGRKQDTGPLLFIGKPETALRITSREREAETTFSIRAPALFPLPEETVSARREDPDPVSRIRKTRSLLHGT